MDLPQPEGPISAVISFLPMSKLTPRTAGLTAVGDLHVLEAEDRLALRGLGGGGALHGRARSRAVLAHAERAAEAALLGLLALVLWLGHWVGHSLTYHFCS